ncbi:hypothetical protein HS99_0030355 [Kitasatospora aureofaciens]|nr:hypothetical protein HS99_0030355 [Kitasatospora aureofaciens]
MDGAEVDVDTNFFEAGANSIHLVRVQRRIAEDFGQELSVVEMFDRPTIRHLADLLDRPAPAAAAEPSPAPGSSARPEAPTEAPSAGGDRRQHHERRRAARRGGSGTNPTG